MSSIVPTNNLAKLGIAAAHSMRLELADQLFYPIAVNILNPSQPMMGGSIGNRAGYAQRITSGGAAGNTGGYRADFNGLEGDPVAVVKTMTSDGPIFTLQKYDGSGIITIEDSALGPPPPGTPDYTTTARYIVKADGKIYDILKLRDFDESNGIPNEDNPITDPANANFNDSYQHWEFAAVNQSTTANPVATPVYNPGALANYNPAGNLYTPNASFAPNLITQNMYTRAVGLISFRPKEGSSASVINDQLSRAQSTLDLMSRLLRSLHDEAKGPFANLVIR